MSQRMKGQGNQVSNGPKEQLGAGEGASGSEEFEPWRSQQQNSAAHTPYGGSVPISSATDLYNMGTAGYYGSGTTYPYQGYGVGDGTWSNGTDMTFLGGYHHESYSMEGMFGPSAATTFSTAAAATPFGQPASSFNYFHTTSNGGDYNTWGGGGGGGGGAGARKYDDYYRGEPQNVYAQQQQQQQQHAPDPSLKGLEQGMQNLDIKSSDGVGVGKETLGVGGQKKATWASIASQPAKPQLTVQNPGLKKKGPGMPPGPIVPGKHNMDIGMWDTGKSAPPQLPMVNQTIPKSVNPGMPVRPVWNGPPAGGRPGGPPPPQSGQRQGGGGGPPPPHQHSAMQSYQAQAMMPPHLPPPVTMPTATGHMQGIMQPAPMPLMVQQQQQHQQHNAHQQNQQQPLHASHPHHQSHHGPPNAPLGHAPNSAHHHHHQQQQQPHHHPHATSTASSTGVTAPNSSAAAAAAAAAIAHPVLDELRVKNNYNPPNFDLTAPNARFFVIKSYSEDDIHRSIKYEIWCSTEHGNKRLDHAFKEREGGRGGGGGGGGSGPIYLFFSVNGSGHFCGMAQMTSPLDYNSNSSVWSQDKWKGQFKVRWIYVKDVPNVQLRHIRLENNENKPVTNSRDTQEVPHAKGLQVLRIMHSFRHSTSIFDDFIHYEKRQEEEDNRKVPVSNNKTGGHHPHPHHQQQQEGPPPHHHQPHPHHQQHPHHHNNHNNQHNSHHHHHSNSNNNNNHNNNNDNVGGGDQQQQQHHQQHHHHPQQQMHRRGGGGGGEQQQPHNGREMGQQQQHHGNNRGGGGGRGHDSRDGEGRDNNHRGGAGGNNGRMDHHHSGHNNNNNNKDRGDSRGRGGGGRGGRN